MGGVPIGLDYGAIMMVAAAQGADLELLTDVLPEFEAAFLAGLDGESGDEDFTDHSEEPKP